MIQLNDNIRSKKPSPLDWRIGPWADIATAKSSIIVAERFVGLEIYLTDGTKWGWIAGTADSNLISLAGGTYSLTKKKQYIVGSGDIGNTTTTWVIKDDSGNNVPNIINESVMVFYQGVALPEYYSGCITMNYTVSYGTGSTSITIPQTLGNGELVIVTYCALI